MHSRNHRMAGFGRDLYESPSPSPLPKQGHPEQAAQHRVQAGLKYLQRRRLHSPSGQPVPGLRHPQREEVLPHVQLELPLLQFVPIAPCPVAGHHWEESGPILLTPTLQIFMGISKVPSQPSLLQAEQAQLPQPLLTGEMLQSPPHPRSPALDSPLRLPQEPGCCPALTGPRWSAPSCFYALAATAPPTGGETPMFLCYTKGSPVTNLR